MDLSFNDTINRLMLDLALSEKNQSVGSKKGGNHKQYLAMAAMEEIVPSTTTDRVFAINGNKLSVNFSKLNSITLVSMRDELSKEFTDEVCAKLVSDDMLALLDGKAKISDVQSATTNYQKDLLNAWSIADELKDNLSNDKTDALVSKLNETRIGNEQLSLIKVVGLNAIINSGIDDRDPSFAVFSVPSLEDADVISIV